MKSGLEAMPLFLLDDLLKPDQFEKVTFLARIVTFICRAWIVNKLSPAQILSKRTFVGGGIDEFPLLLLLSSEKKSQRFLQVQHSIYIRSVSP